jgi:hypothetical protein
MNAPSGGDTLLCRSILFFVSGHEVEKSGVDEARRDSQFELR